MKWKILDADCLQTQLGRERSIMQPILLATGCFDILHRGHVELLEGAKLDFPGHMLWLGLNSDRAVRELKGNSRPINTYEARAIVMAGLQCVDQVFEIDDVRVAETLRLIRPRVWVKGGDYTMDSLDQGEVAAAKEAGTKIHLVPATEGYSTTRIVDKLQGGNESVQACG